MKHGACSTTENPKGGTSFGVERFLRAERIERSNKFTDELARQANSRRALRAPATDNDEVRNEDERLK